MTVITVAASHGLCDGDMITISGIKDSPINGQSFRVSVVSSTSLTVHKAGFFRQLWLVFREALRQAWWDLERLWWEALEDWEDSRRTP